MAARDVSPRWPSGSLGAAFSREVQRVPCAFIGPRATVIPRDNRWALVDSVEHRRTPNPEFYP